MIKNQEKLLWPGGRTRRRTRMWFRVGDWRGSAGMISDVEGTCAGCCAAGVVSGNKGVLLLVS